MHTTNMPPKLVYGILQDDLTAAGSAAIATVHGQIVVAGTILPPGRSIPKGASVVVVWHEPTSAHHLVGTDNIPAGA